MNKTTHEHDLVEKIRDALGAPDGTLPSELPGLIRELREEHMKLARHHAIVEHEVIRLRRGAADGMQSTL